MSSFAKAAQQLALCSAPGAPTRRAPPPFPKEVQAPPLRADGEVQWPGDISVGLVPVRGKAKGTGRGVAKQASSRPESSAGRRRQVEKYTSPTLQGMANCHFMQWLTAADPVYLNEQHLKSQPRPVLFSLMGFCLGLSPTDGPPGPDLEKASNACKGEYLRRGSPMQKTCWTAETVHRFMIAKLKSMDATTDPGEYARNLPAGSNDEPAQLPDWVLASEKKVDAIYKKSAAGEVPEFPQHGYKGRLEKKDKMFYVTVQTTHGEKTVKFPVMDNESWQVYRTKGGDCIWGGVESIPPEYAQEVFSDFFASEAALQNLEEGAPSPGKMKPLGDDPGASSGARLPDPEDHDSGSFGAADASDEEDDADAEHPPDNPKNVVFLYHTKGGGTYLIHPGDRREFRLPSSRDKHGCDDWTVTPHWDNEASGWSYIVDSKSHVADVKARFAHNILMFRKARCRSLGRHREVSGREDAGARRRGPGASKGGRGWRGHAAVCSGDSQRAQRATQ